MKYFVLFLALFPLKVAAQWSDNFSDGDFYNAPAWRGDSANFMVSSPSQLQLNAPAVNGSSYLSTPSVIEYKASWGFTVKMDFNPSATNYAKVFLMSDQSDLTLPLNGYYLRIGGTNDDLCLFRKDGETETLIADGRDKIFNTSTVNTRIKVTRDAAGTWELLCDTTGGANYSLSATAVDSTILISKHFGIQCFYTSTRSTKFYFDDFMVTGEEYKYIEPKPVIDSTQLFDILFNEIMADPTPVAGLPESEYIELYNRSAKPVNMKGWKLYIGSYSYTFPEVQMPADSYLIVMSKGDETKFASFGNVVGLFSSLNNTGQYLKLENREGRLIAWVEYDDSWYADEFKAQGGWSLEQINPLNPCGDKANWKTSVATIGGTPGSKNSVFAENPDTSIPDLVRVNVRNDTIVELCFNEPLDSINATSATTYHVTPDIGLPKIVSICNKEFSAVQLTLLNPLLPGRIYNLQILKTIADCVGHPLPQEISVSIGLPGLPDSSDIVINEVLFNARTGGVDYVELYNHSSKMINARNLLVGTKIDGKVGNLCRLSEPGFLLNPSAYLVLSENREKVKPFYSIRNEKCFADLACMPSLDDKSSTIVLVNDAFGKVDEFTYSEAMHMPTLKSLEGISLERIHPDRPSYLQGNWHSAAETAGYGTPGYQNSQYLSDTFASNSITLSDDIFSPDNDGYKDVLQISYQFNEVGCRVQVYIFDSSGRLVRRLLNNESIGINGSFVWDGTSDAGKLCNVGMYVIFIRTVFDDGTVKEYKRPCVLAIKR